MFRRIDLRVLASACSIALLCGCMPKFTIEELSQMKPQRPAELDALNAFVGSWEATGEATMSIVDEVLTSQGTSETQWEGDGWYLVERGNFSMAGLGEMQGMSVWTYDTHAKVYRTSWVDSMGSIGLGTARHDKKNNAWSLRATAHGPQGKTSMKGHIKFIDKDTAEWRWAEYAFGGLVKTMEMTGTNRRK